MSRDLTPTIVAQLRDENAELRRRLEAASAAFKSLQNSYVGLKTRYESLMLTVGAIVCKEVGALPYRFAVVASHYGKTFQGIAVTFEATPKGVWLLARAEEDEAAGERVFIDCCCPDCVSDRAKAIEPPSTN